MQLNTICFYGIASSSFILTNRNYKVNIKENANIFLFTLDLSQKAERRFTSFSKLYTIPLWQLSSRQYFFF